jgi:hypothetical protein
MGWSDRPSTMACVLIGAASGLVIFISSFWVANDSTHYDWSKWTDPRHPESHCAADSFWTWFLACFLLWPVFFPGYFWDRRYAPARKSGDFTGEHR